MYEIFIGLSIAVLLFFSPLIYGGISAISLLVIELLCFLLFLFTVIRRSLLTRSMRFHGFPVICSILFLGLIAFQLIPLPIKFISLISPNTEALYKGYCVTPFGNFTLSICREATVNMLLQLMSFFAIFTVIANYASTVLRQKRIVQCIIVCGIAYSLFAIISGISVSGTFSSTFTNRNHFAAYVEMIIPLCVAYSFIERNMTKKMLFIFATVILVIALFISMSRGGRLCASSGLVLFFLALIMKKSWKKVMGPTFILIAFISVFFYVIGMATLMQRMDTLLSPERAFAGRLEVIRDSLPLVKNFFVFGTGLGTFGEIFQKYKTFESPFYRFAHNEPLQLLVETGIIGFILIGVFLSVLLHGIYRIWIKRNSPFPVFIALGCFTGILTVLFHSLVEFVFKVPSISLLFFILLSLAYAVVHTKEDNNAQPVTRSKEELLKFPVIFRIVLSCLFVLVVATLICSRYAADSLYESASYEESKYRDMPTTIPGKNLIQKIDKAISLNPINGDYWSKKGELLVKMGFDMTPGEEATKEAGATKNMLLLEQARKCYFKAIELNPANPQHHLHLGWLYHITGDYNVATDEFRKAVSLDPMNKKLLDYIGSLANE